MKKLIALILAAACCLSLFAACGETPAVTTTEHTSTAETTTAQTTTAQTTTEATTPEETTTGTPAVCAHEFEPTDTVPAGYLQDEILISSCALCGEEKRETGKKGIYSIKILAVGNSFSVDAMEYLWDICKSAGFEEVVLGNLYVGGCTLDMHADYISKNSAAYTYYYNDNGIWEANKNVTLDSALTAEGWDFITIQQGSPDSGRPDAFGKLSEILSHLDENKTNENAKIFWHMTWAYQSTSGHSGFAYYEKNQQTMYDAIVKTVNDTVLAEDLIDGVIPAGTAVQNLRTSYFGDKVTRDGYHLKYDIGRYLAGLTWFSALTGCPVSMVTDTPHPHYRELYIHTPVLMEAAEAAVVSPYAVTTCTKAERSAPTETRELTEKERERLIALGYNPEHYLALELRLTPFGQYASTVNANIVYRGTAETHSTLSLFHTTRVFEKADLPKGSLITIAEGYLYFPHAWIETSKGSQKPQRITDTVTVVDEAFWGEMNYRAFDFAHADLKTPMTLEEIDVLMIFIPKA